MFSCGSYPEFRVPGARHRSASLVYERDRLYAAVVHEDAGVTGAAVGLRSVEATRSRTTALAATYRFDLLKLHAYVQHNRVPGLPSATGHLLGATVPTGSGQFTASMLRTNRANARASLFAVGYTHHLSKRTHLYTSAARLNNKDAARYRMWPSSQDVDASILQPGQDMTGFQFGIRHDF